MKTAFEITIDGQPVKVTPGQSVLAAARSLGLDIPTLCYLEKCGPLTSCLVCLVKINGKLVPSCGAQAQPGMVVESETTEINEARKTALELLFSDHVGDCLSPCHRLCPLMLNIPVMLRQIQADRFDEALVTVRQALPLAGVLGRLCHHPCEQGCRRGTWDDPTAIRDMERAVIQQENQRQEPYFPPRRAPSGKSAVIIGAGPAGLAAAWYLARNGHAVTVVDRNNRPGGTLRAVPEAEMPAAVIETDVAQLRELGVEFRLGVELGNHITLDGLLRGFDALLLALGEIAPGTAPSGMPMAGAAVKTDPNTCQTFVARVFATGSAVRPIKQLVRAMAEGRAAAECVHRFLCGRRAQRPEKPFSSIMGRLDPGELRQFLRSAGTHGSVTPCDRCTGLNWREAAREASRCLHCDCRSSGECVLQHYAQVYNVEAGRFRGERRPFEQQRQPAGVLFEPGKCILCGICVKLTELAREPLGLTFIGRGFDVRIGAPFNQAIEEGLRQTAEECVRHCPTGALVFEEKIVAGSAR